MVARTNLFLRYLSIVRRKKVIDCRHVETLPPDCHSLRPRPPPFSPPQTRFPGKRYHEQTASPNKAQVRGAPNPISKKLSHPQGMREFSGAANGIRVSPAGSVFRGSDSPPDCHSLPLPSKSHEHKRRHAHEGHTAFFGAANGIRTHDLVITNDVLYRLSYSSVSNA